MEEKTKSIIGEIIVFCISFAGGMCLYTSQRFEVAIISLLSAILAKITFINKK